MPIIYSPRFGKALISPAMRILAFATVLGCSALLTLAASLTPARGGTGTHEALHLMPCAFLSQTGIPCPSCGMTTSFSWFTRGNLLASLYIQPFGMVLAAACCAWIWIGSYVAITGRPVLRLLRFLPGHNPTMTCGLVLMFFAIAAWGWKIFIHLKGIDGW